MGFHYHHQESENKRVAFAAAEMRNLVNKSHHNDANIRAAQSLARMVEAVVDGDKVYVNFTKKMITVKVQNFRKVINKKLYSAIVTDCKVQGIEIGTTDAASLIFHIYK